MVKRRRLDEEIEYEDDQRSIDRISMLPDELLVSILSVLTFKEAATTGILSRRWRDVWTLVPNLDFGGKNLLTKVFSSLNECELVLRRERRNYIRWVNRVIALRKRLRPSSTVEGFRLYFNLDKTCKKYIDRWIRYALAGKVRRLEVDLKKDAVVGADDFYTFPYKYMYVCDSIHFKYLHKITLKSVNVNCEAVEFFLRNCPLLEDLSLANCLELSNLKIIGPHPSLKCLEINWCVQLNSVEIRDVNLVCFKYIICSRVRFRLQNVPHLVEVSVGAFFAKQMRYLLLRLSGILLQLEKFNILFLEELYYPRWPGIKMLYSSVEMSNLKQLVVNVKLRGDESLLQPLTNLISASPRLQSFALEVSRFEPKFVKRKIKKIVRSYAHLKEVSLCGYRGVTSELELIMHFFENAFALEKIVIDTCNPGVDDYMRNCYPQFMNRYRKEEMDARARAKAQLAKIVPPRINLDIR